MNSIGWQICGVLIGVSFLIIAIFVAKTLNSAQKVLDRADRLIDFNEKNIQDILDNVASISDSIELVTNSIFKLTGIFGLIFGGLRSRKKK